MPSDQRPSGNILGIATLSLKTSGIRWIDVASQSFGYRYVHKMYDPFFFYPDVRPRPIHIAVSGR
jgi:hypothetical protein